jgi:hypothetical protein
MKQQRGFVIGPLAWMAIKGAAIAIAVFAAYQFVDNRWATDAGIKEGIKRQKVETVRVQEEYDTFKTGVENTGKLAKAEHDKRVAAELKDKETKDAQLKTARAALDATITDLVRERRARASGGYLPPASASAGNFERATLVRADFERAMGYLDERGAGIAAQGDGYRIGLDSLKP